MKIKKLTITNKFGKSIEFGKQFQLSDGWDLSGLSANVNYSDSNTNGAAYQSTTLSVREFSVPFFISYAIQDDSYFESMMNKAFVVFNPLANPHRIDIETTTGEEYFLNSELLSSPIFSPDTSFDESNEFWQDGLLQFSCADPFIYKKDKSVINIAAWIPNMIFPLVIPEEGFAFAYRTPSLIANVSNDGHVSSGMIIKFKATGPVENPKLININSYLELKLNMSLMSGDVVEISTEENNVYAKLTRKNVITSVFGRVDILSDFLQVDPGDNLFRYDSDSGLDNLEVTISITNKYLGV